MNSHVHVAFAYVTDFNISSYFIHLMHYFSLRTLWMRVIQCFHPPPILCVYIYKLKEEKKEILSRHLIMREHRHADAHASIKCLRKRKCNKHLNTRQVWYMTDPKNSGCHMVWISYGGLKTGPKLSVLWSKMSGIGMVCLIMWSDHLKTRQKRCLESQMTRFQVFGIQMVTVFFIWSPYAVGI